MKKNTIKEAIDALNHAESILREDFGYGAPMGYEAEGGAMPQDANAQQQMPQQMPQDQEKTDVDLSKNDERVTQIRVMALDGLQDYAEQADSEIYEFFKKIFLMCDKAVSEKDSASGGGAA